MNKKILFKFYLVLILLIILSSSFVYAQNDYYADIVIDVENNGLITFSGTSNHPFLKNQSENFTSKNGQFWLLNISINETFSDALFELILPNNVQINYIKSSASINIFSRDNSPVISGIISNKQFELIVQYSFIYEDNKKTSFNYYYLLLILIIIYLIHYFKREKPNLEDFASNDRQKEIIQLLSKKDMTQKELSDILKIPKSSLSRNIDSLVKKDLIEKKQLGMTNYLSFKKKK